MTIRISAAAREAACNGVVDLIEVGTGTAVLQLWSGSRPATLGDAPAGDKLAEFVLPDPAFGAAAAGVATVAAIDPIVGLADGTVGFAVVRNQNADAVWDNDDVGVGTGQLQLNTLNISVGVAVEVTAYTVTMPAS